MAFCPTPSPPESIFFIISAKTKAHFVESFVVFSLGNCLLKRSVLPLYEQIHNRKLLDYDIGPCPCFLFASRERLGLGPASDDNSNCYLWKQFILVCLIPPTF